MFFFFPFSSTGLFVFFPVLYQQIENRLCTTDQTPTARSIHKVKMNIVVFCQHFQVPLRFPPRSHPYHRLRHSHRGAPPFPSMRLLRVCVCVCEMGVGGEACALVVSCAERQGPSVWMVEGGLWGGGKALCCFSSFRRTTSCRRYYGSTVDTTVFPLIHTLGQQALCSVSG